MTFPDSELVKHVVQEVDDDQFSGNEYFDASGYHGGNDDYASMFGQEQDIGSKDISDIDYDKYFKDLKEQNDQYF